MRKSGSEGMENNKLLLGKYLILEKNPNQLIGILIQQLVLEG